MDPHSWQQRACGIANRNVTHEEWRKNMGDQPYHKTCPDLPDPDDIPRAAAIQAPAGRWQGAISRVGFGALWGSVLPSRRVLSQLDMTPSPAVQALYRALIASSS